MRRMLFSAACAAIAVLAACNDVGDCPAAAAIAPGGSCSGDTLECPYTLESLSLACDGTTVDGGIATSCVCTKGTWSCPSPVSCPSAQGEGGDDQGNAGDDGTSDAPSDAAAE